MKQTLIVLLLLAAIAGHGQINGTFVVNGSDTFYSGIGHRVGYSGIIFWGRSPNEKALYDSGRVEINGDTLVAIRRISKGYDSISQKYQDAHTYAERVIAAAADVITNGDNLRNDGTKIVTTNAIDQEKRLSAFISAVRRYRAFIYDEQPKKKKK